MAVDDSYTVSLLHFDNNFTDQSGKTWTAYGGVTTSSAQSKFGGYSGYFDGVNDYLSTTTSDFAFGTGDFTVDCWVRPPAQATYAILSKFLTWGSDVDFYFLLDGGYPRWVGTGLDLTSSTLVPTTVWSHIAAVRNGNTWNMYLNGTGTATVTYTGAVTNNSTVAYIGARPELSQQFFSGYIDELRISKGIARWTSNFTPPTVAYGSTPLRFAQVF